MMSLIVNLLNESNMTEVFYGLRKLCYLQKTDHLKQLNLDFTEFPKVIYSLNFQ